MSSYRSLARNRDFTALWVGATVAELERQNRINEDVIRWLTIAVEEHEEGPSAQMRKNERDRKRRERDGERN